MAFGFAPSMQRRLPSIGQQANAGGNASQPQPMAPMADPGSFSLSSGMHGIQSALHGAGLGPAPAATPGAAAPGAAAAVDTAAPAAASALGGAEGLGSSIFSKLFALFGG